MTSYWMQKVQHIPTWAIPIVFLFRLFVCLFVFVLHIICDLRLSILSPSSSWLRAAVTKAVFYPPQRWFLPCIFIAKILHPFLSLVDLHRIAPIHATTVCSQLLISFLLLQINSNVRPTWYWKPGNQLLRAFEGIMRPSGRPMCLGKEENINNRWRELYRSKCRPSWQQMWQTLLNNTKQRHTIRHHQEQHALHPPRQTYKTCIGISCTYYERNKTHKDEQSITKTKNEADPAVALLLPEAS